MTIRSLVFLCLLFLTQGHLHAATQWVDLVDASGPVGFADVNEKLALCGDVKLAEDSKGLTPVEGKGVIAVTSKMAFGRSNLNSTQEFGDCELQLEFLIGKGSNSGVKLQQRYEIQLYDSSHKEKPNAKECGGVYPHWVFKNGGGLKYIDEGVPPMTNAAKPAGQWQTLKIVFKAPRFDKAGEKTENAKFVYVSLNGETIQADVDLESPTGNASSPKPEVAKAPIFLQLDHGPVAFRKVRVKPLDLK
ncbi:3-keto-disaccharide hydrolase [Mariniblastus fucicola]|uniref:3-keto-alpha-glucoside-1,2-lyase/3-keto-2-hydroxy-glucal hydratase domain-containing protein n=1 Tax=Mariniblastus fucicola TaxID=980251 RepID=A0A5B9PKH4_9BACT|nr:DUF1080 domain-containing protein [Mariniblastus fucicola]QEG25206.1 hypothetical protein MFFC18_51300 [Mariniblastus fucicola]